MPFGRYVTLIRFSLQLLLRPYPRLSFLFIVLIVLQGVIPSFSVIASIRLGNLVGHGSPNQLLIACLVWAFTLILPEMIAPLISTLQSVLNQKATQLTQHKIMSAVARIDDLQIVEGPALHDSLQMLSKEAAYRPLNLLVNLVDICRGSVTLLSLALVLASVVWWLPLALLLPAIPVAVSVARSQLDVFRTMLGEGKTARLIGYYFSVIVDVKLAKEIKLFGLADFFIAKHHAAFAEMDGVLQQVRKNQFLRPQKWNLLYMISAMGIMLWFSDYLVSGKISTGGLLGTIQSISLFSLSCQWMVYSFGNLRVCLAFFDKLQTLEEAAAVRGTSANRPLPTDCTLRFENVSFAWPDNKPVLHNLNLRINAGEHVAIVGENGAGKSTLIKLLCRLYEPDSGRITLGGVDISQIDRHAWHSRISAVFQDFGRYNLTLAENIVLGDIGSIPSDERIRAASQKAQFSLPAGMAVSSQIGKEFGGTELSGGEWQRLALARAFYADRPLVILDEPTSAMDPRVEAELFSQFGHIMAGKTAVMVTHRLGSVRNVDRVVVMKAGRIVEEGPPQVLEALNGEYAELLALQKNQYADRPASRE